MAAHIDGEPVAVQVPDSHLVCHYVVLSSTAFGRPASTLEASLRERAAAEFDTPYGIDRVVGSLRT